MEKTTTVKALDKNVTVKFEEHIVRVTIDDELTALLAHDAEHATDELVKAIKAEYISIFNTEFLVSDASLSVEIWGHVYAEKFAEAIKKIATFDFIEKLTEKVIERCEIIDIGESGHDYNRFVWNALAPFKSAIAKLLPKK